MQKKAIEGIIFDLDGTLVTSSLNFSQMRKAVGCPDKQDILHFLASLPQSNYARALDIIHQHEWLDAQSATWEEGAEFVVNEFAQRQMPMAIVTRNSRVCASIKIANNSVPIAHLITREDAPPKPNPEALLNVASHWAKGPDKLMYVGDHLYDVEAANRAGMTSVLYVSGELPAYADQADIVIRNMRALSCIIGE